jgi:hypothetical protein
MASACGRPTPAVRCLPRGTLVQAWQGSVVELLRQVSTQELCLRILFVQCEELSRALAAISCRHITMGNMMTRLIAFALLSFAFAVPPAGAVVYCKTVGVPKGCVARPVGSAGVGAPGVGVVDPGINQPGAAGNVGARRAGVGAPGVGVVDPGINQPGAAGNVGAPRAGVGAPGVGVVDPGINQPGAAGNVGAGAVGGPANRGGPVDRVGRR